MKKTIAIFMAIITLVSCMSIVSCGNKKLSPEEEKAVDEALQGIWLGGTMNWMFKDGEFYCETVKNGAVLSKITGTYTIDAKNINITYSNGGHTSLKYKFENGEITFDNKMEKAF